MNLSELIGSFSVAALRRFDPEMAHTLAVTAMRFNLAPGLPEVVDDRLAVSFFDMRLDHPIGLAAGFDKDAEIAGRASEAGLFSRRGRHADATGRSRATRNRASSVLPEANAVINRCGFNGKGHAHALKQLVRRGGRPGVVGINVGANRDSSDRAADYVTGIKAFAGLASYFTVNVSSPKHARPARSAGECRPCRISSPGSSRRATKQPRPSAGKRPCWSRSRPISTRRRSTISPPLSRRAAPTVSWYPTPRLSRSGVFGPTATEPGGLSGKPLFERSTVVLAKMRERVGRALPIIGVGGVMTGEDAYLKMAAGANLVQVYTAFIYGGGNAINAITTDLLARIERSGVGSARALAGSDTRAWASRPIPI